MNFAYNLVLRILEKKLGLIISVDEHDDFAISDYISDSMMFIQFLVAIEEDIGKDLSDDFLVYDIFSSAKGFAEKLDFFISSQRDDNSFAYDQSLE